MKILQMISYFYPAWTYGGPGVLIYNLSRSLINKKHQVTVYSTDVFNDKRRRNGTDNNALAGKKFNYYFFRTISNRFSFATKFFFSPGIIIKLFREIRSFDVIHIHEFFTPNVIITAALACIFRKPFLISAHGTLDKIRIKNRFYLKRLFMQIFGKFIIKKASAFIAATNSEIDEYRDLGVSSGKIYFVPNGIDLSVFTRQKIKSKFRNNWRIAPNEIVILYLGRIHSLKGLAYLLEAFRGLKVKLPVRLVIAGSDDGFQKELKKMIEEKKINNVIFTGLIAGSEKMAAYRECDIFVYPSPSEGFSIAVLEAAAGGLPLIITKGCKFPDVVKYKAGIVCRYDIKDITASLKRVVNNASLRKRMGQNAIKLVKKYDINLMAAALEKIYKNLAVI